MSLDIKLFPPLTLETIENDNNLKIDNDNWILFNNSPICTTDGLVYKSYEYLKEFITYLWQKYKILTGFDGWGEYGDGAYLAMMDYIHAPEILNTIDNKDLKEILIIEYYIQDMLLYVDENIKKELEQYRKENEPYFQKYLNALEELKK